MRRARLKNSNNTDNSDDENDAETEEDDINDDDESDAYGVPIIKVSKDEPLVEAQKYICRTVVSGDPKMHQMQCCCTCGEFIMGQTRFVV